MLCAKKPNEHSVTEVLTAGAIAEVWILGAKTLALDCTRFFSVQKQYYTLNT